MARRRPPKGHRPRHGARRRADESGGAVSLWVVLMVPVSAFAAVVAMAGPQRMAAESSMDEAAVDFATMAVAWRDGHDTPAGAVPQFLPDCEASQRRQALLAQMGLARADADGRANDASLSQADREFAEGERDALDDDIAHLTGLQAEWLAACEAMLEWIVGDLGNLGVDVGSLRGFYSDSLTEAPGNEVPCRISARAEVRDAVHVAIAADWLHAGWAAAQVWPDGTRIGAESIGRMRRSVADSEEAEQCGEHLDVLDSQGRPVWLSDGTADSRTLSQSVPGRTVIEG